MTEASLMEMIREGNLHYHSSASRLTVFADKDLYQLGDPLRENKDMAIIYTALCSRAAMDGGLSPRAAKMLETHYIRAVEQCTDSAELIEIDRAMTEDFVRRVHDCKEHPGVSRPVQECCAYLQIHLLEPVTLKEVAADLGYTEYYLSKKFKRETGMRVSDYLKQARIRYACIQLENTTRNIQDISDELQFNSRSYFSTVFQAQMGMTPAAYRQQRQQPQGQEDEA